MAEIDRSLIGSWAEPFTVEVEKGAIRRFAEAIDDHNPLYHDEAYARRMGHAGLLAPPTFPISFRPPKEPPWSVDLDRRRILAGEMGFTYARPVVAGMVLTCRVQFVGVEQKQGSKGLMELMLQEMTGSDAVLGTIFTHKRTTLYRSLDQVERRSLA